MEYDIFDHGLPLDEGELVTLTSDSGHRLIITQDLPASLEIVSGDEDGLPLGWYSGEYGEYRESSVLRYTVGPDAAEFVTRLQLS